MKPARAALRRLGGALVLALLGAAAQAADLLAPGARAGDLIFREGTEAVSAAVMAVDRGAYSHVGMLVGQPGNWQVVHATPSEVRGRPDGVVVDALAFFLDPRRSRRHAVYHVEAGDEARQRAVALALSMQGRPFRIADPAGTYCTELVWKAWRDAGMDLDVRFTSLALPLLPGNYLLPSDLLASPRLRPLAPATPLPARS
ncbi:YiiX/YebB-like N1pC/P60 family cysteine hydrolase [Pigmentiphaga sp. YJ18]|uniref:YiiX/YebB-like N1pC/P60 family cysteine hydrolase n=1 Tax=Pigmentiphaga sp. YJ18 TaxID=3134907 RepID=UPI003114924C